MFRFSILIISLLGFGMCNSNAEQPAQKSISLKGEGYVVSTTKNPSDEEIKWAEYFYNHLKKRTNDKNKILLQKENPKYITFVLHLNPKATYDYCLKKESKNWKLIVKNEQVMIWAIYQIIKRISEDNTTLVQAPDLNPSIISWDKECVNFDFSYREPHFLPNLNIDYNAINATNNIEIDWGIWGHNLTKIMKNSTKNIFAQIDGKTNTNQLDFSSDQLFEEVENYIIDNFGTEIPTKFVIMPSDNTLVSTSAKGVELGNTSDNATPSVSYFIERLAKRFPNHTFFASSYLTTKTPPKTKLPTNTGVIISTIDLPKAVTLDMDKNIAFRENIRMWRQKVKDVYLWDYVSNFDDYLSPFPILKGFQKQLQVFKKEGVTGVFLNGSGYDYTPFQDVQTFVLSSLLIDETLSVDDLVTRFYKQKYPIFGEQLAQYYLSLENKVQKNGKSLNIYSSFNTAVQTFLDIDSFVNFYQELEQIIPKTKDEERVNLNKMYIALTFTRLQLAYYQSDKKYGFLDYSQNKNVVKPYIQKMLRILKEHSKYKEMANYKEDEGSLQSYISQWENLLTENNFQNFLLGEKLVAKTMLDEDYQDLTILTDGVDGFPYEYHNGWILNSIDHLNVSVPVAKAKKGKELSLTFLKNEVKRFFLPEKIEIYKNNKLYKTIIPSSQQVGLVHINEKINFTDAESIELKIYRNISQKRNLLATSEIRLLP